MRVFFTIDMEQDCPPFLNTYRGITEGTPRLLDLFAKENTPATFFTTGDVARRYPKIVEQIVAAGHELGCHGDTHERFDHMTSDQAEAEIKNSTKTLRRFYPVKSFRAPNLMFPNEYLKFLEAENYQLDSSHAKYKKKAYLAGKDYPTALTRVPASVTSSVLRLPRVIRRPWLGTLSDPVVLFVHPWEFVDFRKSNLRLDCRFRTGDKALQCLQTNIRDFKQKKAQLLRMEALLPADLTT